MRHDDEHEQLYDDDNESDYEDAGEEENDDDGDAVQRFARQLRAQLLRWDPRSYSNNSNSNSSSNSATRAFAAALTEIAALPLDALGMEARRLLVDGDGDDEQDDASPVTRVVAALNCRDVRLKCKAASALGSLCVSRVAGQRLLELHGPAVLRALARMATCRNRWAQADAFCVLGWVVVIADEAALAQVARLLLTVVKLLHASARATEREAEEEGEEEKEDTRETERRRRRTAAASTEDASNFRVYALVLLLNFLQRDASVFAGDAQQPVLDAIHAIVLKLNDAAAEMTSSSSSSSSSSSPSSTNDRMDAAEFVEVARLAVTFLGLLIEQHDTVATLLLEMKMLPSLLRLTKTLRLARAAGLLGDSGVDGFAANDDAGGAGDLEERLAAIVETVISSR